MTDQNYEAMGLIQLVVILGQVMSAMKHKGIPDIQLVEDSIQAIKAA